MIDSQNIRLLKSINGFMLRGVRDEVDLGVARLDYHHLKNLKTKIELQQNGFDQNFNLKKSDFEKKSYLCRCLPCFRRKKIDKIFMMMELQSDKFSSETPTIGFRITTEERILDYCSYLDVAIVMKQTFYRNDEIQHKETDDIQRIREEKEAKRASEVGKANMILGDLQKTINRRETMDLSTNKQKTLQTEFTKQLRKDVKIVMDNQDNKISNFKKLVDTKKNKFKESQRIESIRNVNMLHCTQKTMERDFIVKDIPIIHKRFVQEGMDSLLSQTDGLMKKHSSLQNLVKEPSNTSYFKNNASLNNKSNFNFSSDFQRKSTLKDKEFYLYQINPLIGEPTPECSLHENVFEDDKKNTKLSCSSV